MTLTREIELELARMPRDVREKFERMLAELDNNTKGDVDEHAGHAAGE